MMLPPIRAHFPLKTFHQTWQHRFLATLTGIHGLCPALLGYGKVAQHQSRRNLFSTRCARIWQALHREVLDCERVSLVTSMNLMSMMFIAVLAAVILTSHSLVVLARRL